MHSVLCPPCSHSIVGVVVAHPASPQHHQGGAKDWHTGAHSVSFVRQTKLMKSLLQYCQNRRASLLNASAMDLTLSAILKNQNKSTIIHLRPPLHPLSKHPTISPIGSPTSRPQTLAALSMVHAAWATSHDRTTQNYYYKYTTLGSHLARKEVGAWLSNPRSTRSTPSCAFAQIICINNNDDGPWASRCWLCAGRDRASPASLPTRATWRYTIRLKGANASSKGEVVAAGALQAFFGANVPL